MNNYLVSVIIPFYGKVKVLRETLKSLQIQTDNLFEVVLIDDESPESAIVLYQEFQSFLKIKYFRISNIGKAAARNFGVSKANSNFYIFLDSDIIVQNDWLDKIKQHINKHNKSILVIEGYRNVLDAKTSFSKYIVSIEKSWKPQCLNKCLINNLNFRFSSCSLFVHKDIFLKLNGFNEKLPDAEDFEFGIRALKNNYNIYLDPSIIVYHNDWPTIKLFIDRHNKYNEGKSILLKSNPDYIVFFPVFSNQKVYLKFKNKIIKLTSLITNPFILNENILIEYLPSLLTNILYRIAISSLTNKIGK